jgi:hypothetical protein
MFDFPTCWEFLTSLTVSVLPVAKQFLRQPIRSAAKETRPMKLVCFTGSSVSPLKGWSVIQREESRPKAEDERR